MPQEPYTRTRGEAMTSVHWGQRKLLLSEVELFLYYVPWGQPVLAVYAGSAPGSHILCLSAMFPHVRFELYDPAPFDRELCKASAIQGNVRKFEIHTGNPGGYFDEVVAHHIAARRVQEGSCPALATFYRERTTPEKRVSSPAFALQVLFEACMSRCPESLVFVSDIRSGAEKAADFDEHVEKDMAAQALWHRILRPNVSMLKFRLPYAFTTDKDTKQLVPRTPPTVPYLDGDILLPIWGRQATTETRLVVKGYSPTRVYNIAQYDAQLVWLNKTLRQKTHFAYAPLVDPSLGIDHRFDGAAEVQVLKDYVVGARKEAVGHARRTVLSNLFPQSESQSEDDVVASFVSYLCEVLQSTVTEKADHRDRCIVKRAREALHGPQSVQLAEDRHALERRERARLLWWQSGVERGAGVAGGEGGDARGGTGVGCPSWSLNPLPK